MPTIGTPAYNKASFASSVDISTDFGSSSDRACLVWAWSNGNSGATTVNSAVIDPSGANLSMTADSNRSGLTVFATSGNLRAFYLASASIPTGVKTVRVTFSDANTNVEAWVVPLSDVSAIGTPVQNNANGTSFTTTAVSSAVGHTVIAFITQFATGDTTPVVSTSGTKDYDVNSSNLIFLKGGAIIHAAGAASVTITGTLVHTYEWATQAWDLTGGAAPAPTLTSPTGTGGVGAGSGTVSTNIGNGTLWWKVDASATATDPGAGAESGAGWTSQAVSSSGVQSLTFPGLTSGTKYAHYLHVASGGRSSVVSSSSFVITGGVASTITMTGPSSGPTGFSSDVFTIGADGTITGTIVVTPSDSSGGGTFLPTSVSISNASPTARFKYTAATGGVKTISVTNGGGLPNPSNISYTAATMAVFVSEPLKFNNTTLQPDTLLNYVALYNDTTNALVVKKTGLYTDINGVFTLTDPSLVTGTTYRVDWETAAGQRRMPRKAAS